MWRPGQDAKPQQNVPSRAPRRGLSSDKPLELHANTRTASEHIQALHSPKPIAPCKYLRNLSSALSSESRAPTNWLKPNCPPQAPRTWIALEVSKNSRPGRQHSAKRPRHDGTTHSVCGPVVSPIATSAAALAAHGALHHATTIIQVAAVGIPRCVNRMIRLPREPMTLRQHDDRFPTRADRVATGPGCEASAERAQPYTSPRPLKLTND